MELLAVASSSKEMASIFVGFENGAYYSPHARAPLVLTFTNKMESVYTIPSKVAACKLKINPPRSIQAQPV
jgi:hypothetical protein